MSKNRGWRNKGTFVFGSKHISNVYDGNTFQTSNYTSETIITVSPCIKGGNCDMVKPGSGQTSREYIVDQFKLCTDCKLVTSCLRKKELTQVMDAINSHCL